MNKNILDPDSKLSRFLTRIMELVVLNFFFILTCIPLLTIGASVTALYATTLKMVRNEEGYVLRDYFKSFAKNFKQGTAFWLTALFFYFLLYVVYIAASTTGGMLLTVYTVITWVFGLLYSIYFLLAFALTATFENTWKGTALNGLKMMVAHFPMVITGWLTIALPFLISFGIDTKIMQYAMLFWILIGFALLVMWSSVYYNHIFSKYREGV